LAGERVDKRGMYSFPSEQQAAYLIHS
jgi:hypothetical protein